MVNIVEETISRAKSFKDRVFKKGQSLLQGELDIVQMAKLPRKTVSRIVDNVFGGTVIVDNSIVKAVRGIEILPEKRSAAATMAPPGRTMQNEPVTSPREKIVRIRSV